MPVFSHEILSENFVAQITRNCKSGKCKHIKRFLKTNAYRVQARSYWREEILYQKIWKVKGFYLPSRYVVDQIRQSNQTECTEERRCDREANTLDLGKRKPKIFESQWRTM